ncbi:MAG: SPOR domain-containing protein [Methylococcaceae bacterium]
MGKKWSSNTNPNNRKKKVGVQERLEQHQELSEDDELKAFLEKGGASKSFPELDDQAESNRRYETAVNHLTKEKPESDLLNADDSATVKVSHEQLGQQSINPQKTRQLNSAEPVSTLEDSFTDFDESPSLDVSETDSLEARSFVKEVFSGSVENKSDKEDLPDWVPLEDQKPKEISRSEMIEPVAPTPVPGAEREKTDSHRVNRLEEYRQYNSDDKIDLIEEHQSQIQRATSINTANALTLKYIVFGAILLILILAAGLGLVSYKFRKQINNLNQVIEKSAMSNKDDISVDRKQTIGSEFSEELDELIGSSSGTPLNAESDYRVSDWKDKASSQKKAYEQGQKSAEVSSLDDDPVNYTVERDEQDIAKKTLPEKNAQKDNQKTKAPDDNLSEEVISKLDQGSYTKPSSSLIENDNTAQKDAPVYKNTVLDNNGWVVNLGAFQARQPAKRAADKYTRKGVPVEVVQITIGGQKWYRLRVEGFESKDEAVMYSTRVKKALKLDNVWVTVN